MDGNMYNNFKKKAYFSCMLDNERFQLFSTENAIERFESAFAKYIGTKYAILTNSGISALNLTLSALNIKNKEEIITQAYVCKDVPQLLAKYGNVVFADMDRYYTIDTNDVMKKITQNSRLIIPVHLYGQSSDMNAIKEMADENNLIVIEDCAHALGAEYHGKKVGSIGDVGIFSLRKNMAVNSGGVITLNDDDLACKIREIQKKMEVRYNHLFHIFYFLNMLTVSLLPRKLVPYVYFIPYEVSKLKKDRIQERITDTEASVALSQLNKLDSFIDKTRKNAEYLNENLRQIGGIPEERENTKHVYTKYAVRFINEIQMQKAPEEFRRNGFETGMTYFNEYNTNIKGLKNQLPLTETVARRLIALSIPPSYDENELDSMIDVIRKISS